MDNSSTSQLSEAAKSPKSARSTKSNETSATFALERKKAEKINKEHSLRCSLTTLMGNWAEDRRLLEVDIAKFCKYMTFEIPIKIHSELKIASAGDELSPTLTLSTLITEKQIDQEHASQLSCRSFVTAAQDTLRLRRNVFTIVSPDINKSAGTPVLYGEEVFFRMFDTGGPPLFLKCDVPNLSNFGKSGDHYAVGLTSDPDRFCKFHIVDCNPSQNIFKFNTPVPTFTTVGISHVASNRLLAVEFNDTIVTMLGTDYRISCYTYKDIYKRVTAENHWQFIVKTVGEENSGPDQDGAGPSTSKS